MCQHFRLSSHFTNYIFFRFPEKQEENGLHVFVPEESSLKRKWWRGIYLRKHTLTVKKRAASAVSTNRGLLCVHTSPLYMYWHGIRKKVFLTVRLTVSHAPLLPEPCDLRERERKIIFLKKMFNLACNTTTWRI